MNYESATKKKDTFFRSTYGNPYPHLASSLYPHLTYTTRFMVYQPESNVIMAVKDINPLKMSSFLACHASFYGNGRNGDISFELHSHF